MSSIEEEEELNHPVLHHIEAPTTTSALEKLSKLKLKSENVTSQKFHLIKIKIAEKIDEKLNETSFAHYFDPSNSVLITFTSENEVKIFWRSSEDNKFHLLQFCDVVSKVGINYCEQFLINEIKDNNNGILQRSQGRRNLNLQDVGNSKEQNLLILAAIDNQDDVVTELLKHDFDVDDEDVDGHNAIEKAWISCMNTSNLEINDKCYKISLSLLKNNSKYPRKIEIKIDNNIRNYEFSYENCSESIKKFVDFSEKLHNLVTESKLEELELEIAKGPQLFKFYDRTNKSLMAHAIESNEFNIWKLLISLKLSIGYHEIQNLGEFYKNYELSKKRLIRAEHQKFVRELPSSHVHFLLTCSRIGNNDRRSDERWTLVEEAFRIMDTDKSCSKILKIAAKWKRLTIYFDFKHDTAYYLDPASSLGTKGVIYGDRTIYIGAKNLSDEKYKNKVISYIIHELCHLAVLLTYFNVFDPYPNGESEEKERFEEEVVPECEENGHFEEIVRGVTMYYIKEHHNSEYIVRVVQMLMHYYIQDPSIECDNSKILKDRKEKFEKLFKYYEEVIEKDFDDCLGIIDTLLDDSKDIRYNKLTGPMKARILHSRANFQGQETTLHEIIENDEEALSHLTSKQIRSMLIDGKSIKIGHINTINTKLSAIERQCVIFSYTNYQLIYKTLSQIQNEVEDSNCLILSDSAGAGKTTTFEQLTQKLKENNKNVWVCFIKLRAHRSVFDKCKKVRDLNVEDILESLIVIQDLKNTLEMEIFKFLFSNDRAIMLFDGVDEISPEFNDFMIEMLTILKENTKNQLWISSRPQCAKILEENLNVKAHGLVPYTIEERETFVSEIFEDFCDKFNEELAIEQKVDKLKNLNAFFTSLERNRYNIILGEVNNPLMIKLIIKLYIQDQIDLNPDSANLYDIFDKVTGNLRKEVRQKVESEDDDSFNTTFNLGHVHQVLALKFLFSYDDIKDLSIMKNWNEQRSNWSVDRIQRFGYVTLDARFDKMPNNLFIDFIHKTYAEFFVAQFIMSIIFESNCKDFRIVLWLIRSNNAFNDSTLENFMSNYMQSNKRKIIKGNKNIEYILRFFNICLNHKGFKIDNYENEDNRYCNYSYVKFFLIILSNNSKTIELIWKLKQSENLLKFILFNTKFKFHEISEILQTSFGPNWDEKFNKNIKKFKIDENYCDLKLFEFVENNYNIIDRETIYSTHHIISCLLFLPESVSQKVSLKIFMRFDEISNIKEQEAFMIIMEKFIYDSDNVETLLFFKDQCEKLLKTCCEKDKTLLFKFRSFIIKQFFISDRHYGDEKGLERIKKVHKFKNVWINVKKYKTKLRKFLKDRKIRLSLFGTYSDEEVRIIKEVLLELYKYNKIDIWNIFLYDDSYELFLNDEKFDRFDSFLSDFNDSKLKSVIIRQILLYDHSGDLLLKSVSSGLKIFKRTINIYLNDNSKYFNIRDKLFCSTVFGNLISQILSNMTDEIYPEFKKFRLKLFESDENLLKICLFNARIYKPIECLEKFDILVKFLHDIFENESITVECMRKNMLKYFSKLQFDVDSSTNEMNIVRTLEIFKIYGKCSNDDYKELFNHLKSKNIFLEMISQLSGEFCRFFITLCTKIFKKFKPNPDDCLKCHKTTALEFFKNKEKMKNLEKFLDQIYNDNENRKIVKQNLIYNNLIYLLSHAVQDVELFDIFNKFIIDNNCSFEKIQNILISNKALFEIFMNTSKENYKNLIELMRNVFKTNIKSIEASISLLSGEFIISKHKEIVYNFEEFLLSIIGHNNQDIADTCMIILFQYIYNMQRFEVKTKYETGEKCNCIRFENDFINEAFDKFLCQKHELILSMFYHEEIDEIEILLEFLKRFKNHWDWTQDLFLDEFPFESIRRMSCEVYNAFERFLEIIFKLNKQKLSELIQNEYKNDEILNNENLNCIKFVKKFIEI